MQGVGLGKPGPADDLHLRDTADAVDGEHAVECDVGAVFLERLAGGALGRALVQLEIAGGKGPEAQTWLDGAAAEQDTVVMGEYRARDDLGVLKEHVPKIQAGYPFPIFTIRNEV